MFVFGAPPADTAPTRIRVIHEMETPMTSNTCWARMHRRLSPALFQVLFVVINVAIVAAKFQQVLPSSERWG